MFSQLIRSYMLDVNNLNDALRSVQAVRLGDVAVRSTSDH